MNWIKSKVVMLPTNEKANSLLLSNNNKLSLYNKLKNVKEYKPYHLYFTSNEEIKEGEECYYSSEDVLVYFNEKAYGKKWCRKIIASTYSPLNLPEPSKEFLEVYIKAYNEGKKIEEVLVEYSDDWVEQLRIVYPDSKEFYQPKLKVKSDNTITIRRIKDSWNKEELNEEKGDFIHLFFSEHYNKLSNIGFTSQYIREWIKKNS